MPETPEAQARKEIDRLLMAAGWYVCDVKPADIHAARGVAIREFPLADGHGYADYLLYEDGKAAGVIEAKKIGATLIGVEIQSARYAKGLPSSLPAWSRPLPFVYEATGIYTHFSSDLHHSAMTHGVHTPDHILTIAGSCRDRFPQRNDADRLRDGSTWRCGPHVANH